MEETAQMKQALAQSEKQGVDLEPPRGMALITCAASELINTGNYSNVTVGPIQVKRFVTDGDDAHLRAEIKRTQSLCEEAVAEERETIQALLRSNAAARSSN